MSGTSSSKGNGDESKHFSPGDVVLGKIKGYPPWPGILVDDENVPKNKVLSSRPGKNFFTVRFFPAADYGFNKANELRKLHKKEIDAYLNDPHKRAAELRSAYELARDPEEWNEEQNQIVRKAELAGEDEEEEDMLAEDDEDVKPAKKRKVPAKESSNKKVKLSGASSKKPSVKSKAVPRKSAGTEAEDGEDGEQMDPETKKVRGWRHSLQRGFLSRDRKVQVDDLPHMHKTMEQVEEYNGITADILRLTKIGKVMRRIIALDDIPQEEEYKFKERAGKLCDKWTDIFSAAKGTVEGSAPPASSAPAATNGVGDGQGKEESVDAHIPAPETSKSEEVAA